MPKLF